MSKDIKELLEYLLKEKRFITKQMNRAENEENKTAIECRYNQLVLIDRVIRKVYEISREQERKEDKAECSGNFCAEWIVIGDELCKKCNDVSCIKNPKNQHKETKQNEQKQTWSKTLSDRTMEAVKKAVEEKWKNATSHENLMKYGEAIADGLKDGIKDRNEELVMSIKNRLKLRTQENWFCYDGDLMKRNGEYYVPDWVIIAYIKGKLKYNTEGELFAETKQGLKHVKVGDCICKCDNGDLVVVESNNIILMRLALGIVEKCGEKYC